MRAHVIFTGLSVIALSAVIGCCTKSSETCFVPEPYDVDVMYDDNQPQPPVITPPSASQQEQAGTAPSDAIVLFDGQDLSQWVGQDGNPPKWKVENGYMEVVRRTGKIFTKQEFGSCQLHVEWASPTEITGEGQKRGNSGIFLMSKYEFQILDSYNSTTYPAGMAGSVYAQNQPLVNVCRAPGEWQTYDIVFHQPVFENGTVVKPAVVTAFHNGVLVQDHFELFGATAFKKAPTYEEHPVKLPLGLQDHGNPVRFRNIWIRPLEP